jgi:hypothetical protein
MAAAIGEPGGSSGKVNVIGGFLKGNSALIQVSDEEGGRIKGRDWRAGRRRNRPRKNGPEQRARQGDAVVGSRARCDTVKNGVGFVTERTEGGDMRVHTVGTLMRE